MFPNSDYFALWDTAISQFVFLADIGLTIFSRVASADFAHSQDHLQAILGTNCTPRHAVRLILMGKVAQRRQAILETQRRFPWFLVILLISGIAMSVVFVMLSFRQPRVQTDQTIYSTFEPFVSLGVDPSGQFPNQVGLPAPDFTLPTLNGGSLTLSVFRGKGVLINFWASWCEPCRDEAVNLERAYVTYRDKGFVILAVDSTLQDKLEDVRLFLQEFNVTYPVLLDETGQVMRDLYAVPGLPMSVFVDRQGIVTHIHLGALSAEQLDEYVGEIVK